MLRNLVHSSWLVLLLLYVGCLFTAPAQITAVKQAAAATAYVAQDEQDTDEQDTDEQIPTNKQPQTKTLPMRLPSRTEMQPTQRRRKQKRKPTRA